MRSLILVLLLVGAAAQAADQRAYRSPNQRDRVGTDTILFLDQVEGSSVNTNYWSQTTTTMTIVQATRLMTLNNGAITTASTNAQVASVKQTTISSQFAYEARFRAQTTNLPLANSAAQIGFGSASAGTAATVGCYFSWTAANTFLAVATFSSADTTSTLTAPNSNVHDYVVTMAPHECLFWIDGAQVARIAAGTSNESIVSTSRMPFFARVFIGVSTPASAPKLAVGEVTVTEVDHEENRSWREKASGFGRGSWQSPTSTFTQTSLFGNSASPTACTLSNTAGCLATTSFCGIAVATQTNVSGTDYIIVGYQVPIGYQLFVTAIQITSAVNVAIGASTNPTDLIWFAATNSSAVSLATVDGTGTWQPRRVALGIQSFPSAAVIGTLATNPVLSLPFDPPLVVDSGRFFHVGFKQLNAPGTAAGSYFFSIGCNGWFE